VSIIELLAEGMTLSEKNDISREHYMSFIDEVFPLQIVHGYGSRMAADAFDARQGFTVQLGLKVRWAGAARGAAAEPPPWLRPRAPVQDVNLMRRLGEASDTPLPLADIAHQHLLAARAAGLGDKDWASLAVSVRQSAGLPPPPQ
jgi:3-hydroxyisobutyrate dehydrogenase-like beta-hydroxyacid dehydrogenase